MATFNLGSAGNVQDLKQVKSYLYKLEEQLKYMFANLDPEENFDSRAKLIYAANAERQAALEVALEGITASYVTKETFSQLALTKDQAALRYVNKNGVISEINASSEQVTIKAEKISLEGTVTANNYFKIKQDGSMEAVNGKFSGELVAATGKFSGQLQAATGTFSGNLSAAGGTFSGDISGASGTFSGTVRGGTIAIGGTSAANAPFKVDSSGNLWAGGVGSAAPFQVSNTGTVTITGSIKTKGTGANYPFMKLSNGIWEGGRYYNGAETVGGKIVFEDSITKFDPVTRTTSQISAMSLQSDGVILRGGVFTALNQSTNNLYQGISRADTSKQITGTDSGSALIDICYGLNGDFDTQEGWVTYRPLQLQFVNGLLVSCSLQNEVTIQVWG